MNNIETGSRVRLRRDVERYPHFIAKAGMTGTVTFVDERSICVHMDAHLDGAEQWDNEVVWYDEGPGSGMGREEFMDDVEVLARDRTAASRAQSASVDAPASTVAINVLEHAGCDRGVARDWLMTVARHIGLGMHPDTKGREYVNHGRRSLSDADAARYDRGIEVCSEYLDPYAVVILSLMDKPSEVFHFVYDTFLGEKATLDNVTLWESDGEMKGVRFSTDAWDGLVDDFDHDACTVRVTLICPESSFNAGDGGREMAMLRCHPSEVLEAITSLEALLRSLCV